MSFMSISGGTGSSKKWWNYSNPEKEAYSTRIVGHVVEISLTPRTEYNTNKIERFDDGNPKRDIRLVILDGAGEEWNFQFSPGGRDKRKFDKNGNVISGEDRRSAMMKALAEAIVTSVPGADDIEDILGMKIEITTKEPPAGWSYSKGTPRPWTVRINPNDRVEHRGCSIKPDWEREGDEADAQPTEPPQVGVDSKLAANMAAAQAATQRNQINTGVAPQSTWAQDEIPPASVYDEDIPF